MSKYKIIGTEIADNETTLVVWDVDSELDFSDIENSLIQRVEKRLENVDENGNQIKRSRFGSAEHFRRNKKVKKKSHDRNEPPILAQPHIPYSDATDFAENSRKKGSYRPIVPF